MLKSEFKKLSDVKAAAAEKLRQLEIENKSLIPGKQLFDNNNSQYVFEIFGLSQQSFSS
jgi:hypothetical protein